MLRFHCHDAAHLRSLTASWLGGVCIGGVRLLGVSVPTMGDCDGGVMKEMGLKAGAFMPLGFMLHSRQAAAGKTGCQEAPKKHFPSGAYGIQVSCRRKS